MSNPAAKFNEKSGLIAIEGSTSTQSLSMRRYLSVVILTLNEEVNLSACLESIRPLGCAVFVVDSGSVDRTEKIAREAGATFVHHSFENQAQQLNWALENLPITSPWIMRLDADE